MVLTNPDPLVVKVYTDPVLSVPTTMTGITFVTVWTGAMTVLAVAMYIIRV